MKHKPIYFLLLLILFLFIFSSCHKSSSTEPTDTNPLLGTWTETFQWINLLNQTQPEMNTSINDSGITRTSTLNFGANTFVVKILPPHRIISLQRPGITTYSTDTNYSGAYYVIDDTLILHTDDVEERFVFLQVEDTLHLQSAGKRLNDSTTSFPVYSILWANSDYKTGGKFIKIK